MNVLCYDPAYQNHSFVQSIQEIFDLRHARGLLSRKCRMSSTKKRSPNSFLR